MSTQKKSSHPKKNILVSSNEIEQFKSMLDNFGRDLSILNTNYKQLIDCKYILIYNNFIFRFPKHFCK